MITCQFENGDETSLRHITVNTIIVRKGNVLLGKRGMRKGKPISEFGKWGLLGGYFDRNENLVQAAAREVMEESGWEISNMRLFCINDNPDRPREDRQNVDFIYIAEAVKQTGLVDGEVVELKWFGLGELPLLEEFAFDHGQAVMLYRDYLANPFILPKIGL